MIPALEGNLIERGGCAKTIECHRHGLKRVLVQLSTHLLEVDKVLHQAFGFPSFLPFLASVVLVTIFNAPISRDDEYLNYICAVCRNFVDNLEDFMSEYVSLQNVSTCIYPGKTMRDHAATSNTTTSTNLNQNGHMSGLATMLTKSNMESECARDVNDFANVIPLRFYAIANFPRP